MRANELDTIRSLPLFADASEETFRIATAGAQLQDFPADAALLLEGEQPACLHVLLEGQVELHAAWNARETVLAVLRPVSTFTLAAVVLGADALMSAQTLQRCKILLIPGDAIRTAMRLDPEFAAAVSRELAGCYRALVRAIKNHKLRNGVERLTNYLLAIRASDDAGGTVRLHCEKRVLASLLGMTPENLSRAFAALHARGVRVHGAVVSLADIAALEALAKPDPLIDNHVPRSGFPISESEAELRATAMHRAQTRGAHHV